MADLEVIVPHYVHLDESGQRILLESCGIRERDDLIIFRLLCEQASSADNPVILPEKFALKIVEWAENNNYTRLRLMQNCKRALTQLAMILGEKRVCEHVFEGAEIRRITLTDPNLVYLSDAYRDLEETAAADFPILESLKFQTGPDQIVPYDLRNQDFSVLPHYSQEGKICRIEFGESGRYVLCPPIRIPDLQNICMKKIRQYLNPALRSKLIEDLSKDMQYLMPEKTSNTDKIIRLINGQDQESPAYFMNLTNRLSSYLNIDKDKKGVMPVYISSKMLELIKIGETNSSSVQEASKKRDSDIAQIVEYLSSLPRGFTISDLLALQSTAHSLLSLSEKYESRQFQTLIQELLEKNTVFSPDLTESERQMELLPKLVKIKSASGDEFFIHRKSIGPFLDMERKRIRDELRNLFLTEWYQLMIMGKSKPVMKFDETFNTDLRKKIELKSPLFVSMLAQPQTVYNGFYIAGSKEQVTPMVNLYFYPGVKPLVKAYHEILQLNRREIIEEVMRRLPWFVRFPLIRWILSLFGITFGREKALPVKESEQKIEGVSRSGTDALRKAISDLEKNLTGDSSLPTRLTILENKWNIKIGEARLQFKDKIDQQISNRAKRLFVMLQRVPELQSAYVQREISNIAGLIVSDVKDEVREKDALKQYAELKALSLYHNRSY